MNWPVLLLDSVAERGSGHTPSQKHPEYWNDGIKWVSLADSSALDKLYIFDTAKKISELGLRHSSAVLHPKGTVILSRDAGVGKSAILGDKMAVSQHFIAWRCDEKRGLCSEYLYQWLQSEKTEFERIASGSTVKTIGLRYFERLRLPVPPIDVQKRIAFALATWDTAIQKAEQLIAAKERRLVTMTRDLITHRSKEKGWPQVRICEIADRIQRRSDSGNHPLLTISSAAGFVRQEDRYSRYMAGESAKTYTLLREGEFAYNKGNSKRYEFGCVFQLQGYESALVPSVYVSFKLHDSVCAGYMRHLFAADYLKPQLRALVKTGVRNNGLLNIRPDEFMGTTVPVPSLEAQIRIANVLDAGRAEIALLTQQLLALRTQKRGLMQKLLTGQWRLGQSKEIPA